MTRITAADLQPLVPLPEVPPGYAGLDAEGNPVSHADMYARAEASTVWASPDQRAPMPDPGLLTAVADALPGEGFLLWRHGDDVGSIEREDAASAVLAALGTVLADLLHEREANLHRTQDNAVDGGLHRYAERLAAQAAALGEVADVWLPRWCGVSVSDQEGQRG